MAEERSRIYDVAVIGGGVVGCAVLYELAKYRLSLVMLEKAADVAEGATKANSGVIHAGFNVPNGSLKARANVAGLGAIYGLASTLGVPHRMTGKLVLGSTDEDRRRLEELKACGDRNGTPGLALVDERAIARLEPRARGRTALYSPRTGIISPYELAIALAGTAVANGARVVLEAGVSSVRVEPKGAASADESFFRLATPRGAFLTRRVVNAAGLCADDVARLAGSGDFTVYPYRGEYLVTDKSPAGGVSIPVYPVPRRDDPGLGVHITPTMESNLLIGPSAEYVPAKGDVASTREIMDEMRREAAALVPGLEKAVVITSFAGLRPKLVPPDEPGGFRDFVVRESDRRPGWIDLVGIESPGLTASPALAVMVADILGSRMELRPRSDFRPAPERGDHRRRFAAASDEERAERAAADPNAGELVCRCEHVTRAEILAAVRDPLGARTIDAVKRRTRCGMGRCHGGFCTPRIVEALIAEGVPPEKLSKRGPGSELFLGRLKPAEPPAGKGKR